MIIWRCVPKHDDVIRGHIKGAIFQITNPVRLKLCMYIDRDVLYLKMEVTSWWRYGKILY